MTIDLEAIKGRCNRAAALDKSAIYCLIEADIPDLIAEVGWLLGHIEASVQRLEPLLEDDQLNVSAWYFVDKVVRVLKEKALGEGDEVQQL